ncbi:MAG: hypothetical protein RL240_1594 [Planctomycetota bacterium]|jgi:hypothetical protein
MSYFAIFKHEQEVSSDLKAWIEDNKASCKIYGWKNIDDLCLEIDNRTVDTVIVQSLEALLFDERFDRLTKLCIDNSVRLTSINYIDKPTSPLASLIDRLEEYLIHRLGQGDDVHEPMYDALWRIENRLRSLEKELWCYPSSHRSQDTANSLALLTETEKDLLSKMSFTETRTAYQITKATWECGSNSGHVKAALRNLVRLGFAKSSTKGYVRCA